MDDSAQNRQGLLRELQQQVKNLLASVRSLSVQTIADSRDLDEFEQAFEGRLAALARTQNLLIGPEYNRLDLTELVLEELLAHAARPDGHVEVEGPDLAIKGRAAQTLSLAIHELATNAVKFGALSSAEGRISVCWRVERRGDGPHLVFEWREQGAELDGEPPIDGFSRRLIERTLPYELGARSRLEFPRAGCHCILEIPFEGNIELLDSRSAWREEDET